MSETNFPTCESCGDETTLGVGPVMRADSNGPQGSLQVDHAEAFQCANEKCEKFGVAVPGPHAG